MMKFSPSDLLGSVVAIGIVVGLSMGPLPPRIYFERTIQLGSGDPDGLLARHPELEVGPEEMRNTLHNHAGPVSLTARTKGPVAPEAFFALADDVVGAFVVTTSFWSTFHVKRREAVARRTISRVTYQGLRVHSGCTPGNTTYTVLGFAFELDHQRGTVRSYQIPGDD